jgi:hypothetical protein
MSIENHDYRGLVEQLSDPATRTAAYVEFTG